MGRRLWFDCGPHVERSSKCWKPLGTRRRACGGFTEHGSAELAIPVTIEAHHHHPSLRLGRTALGVALWLLTATPGFARADPELSLRWQTAPGCPELGTIRAKVERLLGRPLTSDAPSTLEASGTVLPAGDGYKLELRTRSTAAGDGSRILRAAECGALADAAALVLALAIDPERVAALDAETNTEKSDPAADPPLSEDTGAESGPDPTDRDAGGAAASETSGARAPIKSQLGAGVGLSVDMGTLPRPAPGPTAWVFVEMGRLRLDVTGSLFPPRSTGGSLGADVGLFTVAAQGCARAMGNSLSLWPCVAFEAGRITGKGGKQLDESKAGHRVWLAPLVGLRGAWQALGWLTMNAELQAGFPLTRPTFVVSAGDTPNDVHRPNPFIGRLVLGAEVMF
jgi:hypothetical protein